MLLDQIKARLKAKLQTLGVNNLSNQRIDEIAARLDKKITEETEIDAKLDEYNEVFPFAELAKQDDKVRTLESQVKKPAQQQQQQKQEEQKQDDTPEWAKSLLEKVTKLENEKVQATISQKVASHEKLKGVPASFYKGRTLPTKEEELDAFVEQISTDFTQFQQELADKTAASGGTPIIGTGTTNVKDAQVDADIKAWSESKSSQTQTSKK